ncbi:MAG: hypothetical protein ACD_15C00003G0015 [uncultured bacterium]|nr:MAG: hypothetical protein ACD_15C00003G0015 [uncultured bacterium]HCU70693.1 dUTP diphosphatase [Candidatus Moranbacteria bacterium]
MKIQIQKINSEAKIPKYTIDGDAGMELYSVDDMIILPGQILACATGIIVAIPDGYAGLIWDKSGIALNGGIKTMGGVIDSNYRGEVRVILKNLSEKEYIIGRGNKIAQMIIQKVEAPILEEVDELSKTERGGGGFGSTGLI